LSNWAEDVAELADHLSIARFDVAAVSGGGPYALACAYYLEHRVANIIVACGVGPYQQMIMRDMTWPARFGLFLAHRQSKLLLPVLLFPSWLLLRTMPRQLLRIFARVSPVTDKEVLSEPNVIETLAVALAEAVRSGFSGILQDMQIYSHPWGFDLEKIEATLHIWHGEMDQVVPVSHGRYVTAHVADSDSRFFSHEAHFSVPINYIKEMLAVFVG
jgi:pimeloyl-ACP methyl ester carboxylesterase